ncbi:hypothetical protein GCM10011380_23020 [Sphingomonas metalli]|uniref:SH3 domain-containing protein n=1 Tax=Sphingomonas metalli TaxID=1779358 RepID=A0A916T5Z0_9SPHN|nr:SH3 domain-containing protein [Sphingomonas metalli]GGB32970.1 hypothetical protein GCM10011380_23020 [Sphingomonas metalli]
MDIDPRTQAVRPDLADVRLADQVFAPHYAAPVVRRLSVDSALRADRGPEGEVLAELGAGDPFELLDVTGGIAWGTAPGVGLVGYLPAAALEPAA